MSGFSEDAEKIEPLLRTLPTRWEGKPSVLEMKEADFHWRQMEWWAFYFELLCSKHLCPPLQMPGRRIDRVTWDAKGLIDWDLKAKAIKSDSQDFILNDEEATRRVVAEQGELGLIIALCDVEYNDKDRSFQRWREELRGGKSDYTKAREKRTSNSRYRKTLAVLTEVLFVRLDGSSLDQLGRMSQGRNSNGRPRPPKFMFHLEKHADLIDRRVELGSPLS